MGDRWAFSILLGWALLVVGCDSDSGVDASGPEAGPVDSGSMGDAAPDAAPDAGPDSGSVPGSDAGFDAGRDSGPRIDGGTVFLLKNATFEGGSSGESPTTGATGFDGAGGGNEYSTEQAYTGALSAKMFKYPDVRTFSFGGQTNYPSALVEGDEVWWRAAVFFPTAEDFNADPRLKFFRIVKLMHADGSHWGYLDWYINRNGTHRYIYEPGGVREDTGESVRAQGLARSDDFGSSGDPASAVIPGEWAEWQLHLRLHRFPADAQADGAFVRFYKDGVLIHERTDIPTLLQDSGGGAYADGGLFMTYWNGVGPDFPSDGSWYVDDFTVAVSRDLTGSLETLSLTADSNGYPIIAAP